MSNIFISHKTEDSAKALDANSFLSKFGLNSYLAVLDDVIDREPDVSTYLRGIIEKYDNLLVIFTEKTKLSWWVPFKVGIATQLDKKLQLLFTIKHRPLIYRPF